MQTDRQACACGALHETAARQRRTQTSTNALMLPLSYTPGRLYSPNSRRGKEPPRHTSTSCLPRPSQTSPLPTGTHPPAQPQRNGQFSNHGGLCGLRGQLETKLSFEVVQNTVGPGCHLLGTHPSPHVPSKCKGCVGAIELSVSIQVADVDLDAGVILGCDQLVGPGAAWTAHPHLLCLFPNFLSRILK